jgi:hypothetical protein
VGRNAQAADLNDSDLVLGFYVMIHTCEFGGGLSALAQFVGWKKGFGKPAPRKQTQRISKIGS